MTPVCVIHTTAIVSQTAIFKRDRRTIDTNSFNCKHRPRLTCLSVIRVTFAIMSRKRALANTCNKRFQFSKRHD
jgi:hypothetical protein